MSFDLIVWRGSPTSPSLLWGELADEGETTGLDRLPCEQLAAAFERELDEDVRVRRSVEPKGIQVTGRGWECWLEDSAWTTIVCDWSLAESGAAIGALVRSAHAAGCSVYDPQWGAYWPESLGSPEGADAWSSAVFDEGFVCEDQDHDGSVRSTPMRLCPEDFAPSDAVRLSAHVVDGLAIAQSAPGSMPLFWQIVFARAELYRERFRGSTITIEFCGPDANALARTNLAQRLERANAILGITTATAPTVAFAVLGRFDASALPGQLGPCPFELVPLRDEVALLAAIFKDRVASLAVVVPRRIVAAAPDVVRTALHALHAYLLALTDGAALYFADPAKTDDSNAGANLAWVEALVGLTPSEPVREVPASEVPVPEDEDEDADADV